MHLNNRTAIESWKQKYSYDEDALRRIDEYLQHHKYAMEISDFQNTTEIPLNRLREDVPGFVAPQMYYFIDDSILLDYLKENLTAEGKRIIHDFDDVPSNQICKL